MPVICVEVARKEGQIRRLSSVLPRSCYEPGCACEVKFIASACLVPPRDAVLFRNVLVDETTVRSDYQYPHPPQYHQRYLALELL